MRRFLFPAVFCVLTPVFARADEIPPCAAPKGVAVYVSVKDLPRVLSQTLKDRFGYLAEPNESFDATDVMMTGHPNRLIFVWNAGNVWLVARERGGIAYSDPIQTFTLENGHAKLVSERSAIPNTVCSIAHAMMRESR